jgi:hypothetical protein
MLQALDIVPTAGPGVKPDDHVRTHDGGLGWGIDGLDVNAHYDGYFLPLDPGPA